MIEELNQLPQPIYIHDAVLHLYPSPAGPQHDECKEGFPGIWGKLGVKWKNKPRTIDPEAPLHPLLAHETYSLVRATSV
jgi:hypothetical protein